MTGKTNAIVTASYALDFERCRVLCETIDAHLTGFTKHYILVDTHDVALFAQLAGPNRVIVSDKTLLPWWIFRLSGRFMPGGKTAWLSPRTAPMHGWHVQQLRRIAIAHHVPEDALFYCDSDTAFSKSFDLNTLWKGDALRLLCEPGAAKTALSDHMVWRDHAARTIGTDSIKDNQNNYVRTFIAWRRDVVLAMCKRISDVHGTHWMVPVASSRKFSECTLYGTYADAHCDPALHWHDDRDFCAMHWFDPPPTSEDLAALVAQMADYQIGFGVQSFLPVDLEEFRAVALGAN